VTENGPPPYPFFLFTAKARTYSSSRARLSCLYPVAQGMLWGSKDCCAPVHPVRNSLLEQLVTSLTTFNPSFRQLIFTFLQLCWSTQLFAGLAQICAFSCRLTPPLDRGVDRPAASSALPLFFLRRPGSSLSPPPFPTPLLLRVINRRTPSAHGQS